ncbi:6556_t:CDS:2 [Entrophospora sp. SA101]|nr:6556_t:CDS:2 [Entrophospora sp. SA101]
MSTTMTSQQQPVPQQSPQFPQSYPNPQYYQYNNDANQYSNPYSKSTILSKPSILFEHQPSTLYEPRIPSTRIDIITNDVIVSDETEKIGKADENI